jgi:hypothetical protein
MAARTTSHQKAEAELTAYALSLPETDLVPGWGPTRYLRVRRKGFCVFGDKDQGPDALTIIVKLPRSAEMVQQLHFVREASDWFRRHNWIVARFEAGDDILAELDTLKAWIRQSYCVMAPKTLARLVE